MFSDYSADQAIIARDYIKGSSKKLYVVFPPYHNGSVVYKRLVKRLAKRGDTVLAYYFHDGVLQSDISKVRDSFEFISAKILNDINEIIQSNQYESVVLAAMSLGNVPLSMIVKYIPNVSKIHMVVPSESLARAIWKSASTRYIRTGLEKKGHDLPEVEAAWHNLAPSSHIDEFGSNDLKLYLSRTDKIIPPEYQVKLLEDFKNHGSKVSGKKSVLGHKLLIIKFCLFARI